MNATQQHRLACEVREWKRRIKQNGAAWWTEQKRDIKKHRGQAGLDILVNAWRGDDNANMG